MPMPRMILLEARRSSPWPWAGFLSAPFGIGSPRLEQDLTLRRAAVVSCLTRLVDGKPGLVVSPACRTLRTGFQGAYCYRRLRVTGDERYTDKPDKNKFSHPHEALQYLCSALMAENLLPPAPPLLDFSPADAFVGV